MEFLQEWFILIVLWLGFVSLVELVWGMIKEVITAFKIKRLKASQEAEKKVREAADQERYQHFDTRYNVLKSEMNLLSTKVSSMKENEDQ